MKRKRFTEEQIAFALRQVEGGVPVKEVCRKLQISEQTFYRWKKKSGGQTSGRSSPLGIDYVGAGTCGGSRRNGCHFQ